MEAWQNSQLGQRRAKHCPPIHLISLDTHHICESVRQAPFLPPRPLKNLTVLVSGLKAAAAFMNTSSSSEGLGRAGSVATCSHPAAKNPHQPT